MTTKVQGTSGVEFPDATVQGSAAYTKAESDAAYAPKTYQSGDVIQQKVFTDAGNTTTNGSLTNLIGTVKSITPKSTNSTILVSISGSYRCSPVGGFNTTSSFRLYEGSVSTPIGALQQVTAQVSAGGNGLFVNGVVEAVVSNTALTTRSFGIGGYTNNASSPAEASSLVITLTEVQN